MTRHLIAASHGTRSAVGRAAVASLVEAVRARVPQVEVHDAFVDVQDPTPTAVLRGIGDVPATIVPLLLAPGFHVHHDLAIAARRPSTTVAGCLGPDPRLTAVLIDRLVEAGWRAGDDVVLGGAGSTDQRAHEAVHAQADLLAARLGRPVPVGHLGGTGRPLADVVAEARRPGRRVAVATYLLAPGFFADLARASGADVVTEPLLTPDATPDELVEIVLDRFRSTDAAASPVSGPTLGRRRVGARQM